MRSPSESLNRPQQILLVKVQLLDVSDTKLRCFRNRKKRIPTETLSEGFIERWEYAARQTSHISPDSNPLLHVKLDSENVYTYAWLRAVIELSKFFLCRILVRDAEILVERVRPGGRSSKRCPHDESSLNESVKTYGTVSCCGYWRMELHSSKILWNFEPP